MKKLLVTSILSMSVCLFITVGFTQETAKVKPGEAMFKKHCAICHRDGGNIVNPKKTLYKKDLDASNFKKADDIVRLMRNGGTGMPKFNEKTIPDKDATEIAEYILKTFK